MSAGRGERERRRERAKAAPALMERVVAAGGRFELLSPENHHYRITGPAGGRIDFWPSTGRWRAIDDSGDTGIGIDGLLERMSGIQPGPVVERPRNNGSTVTIFADGSFDYPSRAGGVGYFVLAHGEVLKGGGPMFGCSGSLEVEIAALADAIQAAVRAGFVKRGQAVILESDCMNALNIIAKLLPEAKLATSIKGGVMVRAARRVVATVRDSKHLHNLTARCKTLELDVTLRHVHGHQGGKADGRGELNAVCDRVARQGMLEAKRKLKAST